MREAVIRKAGAVVLAGTDHSGVTRAVLQAALDAEMTGHLGYDEGERLAIPAGTIGAAAMTPGPGSQAG